MVDDSSKDIDLEYKEDEEVVEKKEDVKENKSEDDKETEGEDKEELITNLTGDEDEESGEDGEKDGEESKEAVSLFANYLVQAGALKDKEGINNFDDIAATLKKERSDYRNSFVDGMPSDLKIMTEAYMRGDNPSDYVQESKAISDYSKIKDKDIDKDEDMALRIIKDHMKYRGFSKEEIEYDVELYKDAGVIPEKAKTAKNKMIDVNKELIEQKKKDYEIRKEQYTKSQETFKKGLDDYLDNTKEMFGNSISEEDIAGIKKSIFSIDKNNTSKLQKLLENDPTALIQISYLMNEGALGKDADFNRIGLGKRRDIVEELERASKYKKKSQGANRVSTKEEDQIQKAVNSIHSAFKGLKP